MHRLSVFPWKITDVKTVLLTGPNSNDPFVSISRTLRAAAFIEIHTDADVIGIGEPYTGYHAPEVVPGIVEFFKPILSWIGCSISLPATSSAGSMADRTEALRQP